MSASKSNAWLFAQLACVADRAQLVSRVQAWLCLVLARGVEAGQLMFLACTCIRSVPALKHILALLDRILIVFLFGLAALDLLHNLIGCIRLCCHSLFFD